jgi:hypothetical protein
MIRAVNRGLQDIDGEFFVKLDADDLIGSLQRTVELLELHPRVGFVYGRPHIFPDGVQPYGPRSRRRWTFRSAAEEVAARTRPHSTVWHGAHWLTLRYQRGVNCILQPEAVIRTSVLRGVGEYNIGLPHTSDLEMWLRLSSVSDVARINREVQGCYRVHPGSMTRTANAGLLLDLIGRREASMSALSSIGRRALDTHDLLDIHGLEVTIRRRLAIEALDNACSGYDRTQAEAVDVRSFVDFAITTFSSATMLPQWRTLETRPSRWTPGSVAARAIRRCRKRSDYWRRVSMGV